MSNRGLAHSLPPAGSPDWGAALESLTALRAATAAVQRLALESINRDDADALVAGAAELARSMAQHLPLLQQAAAHGAAAPAEFALQLQGWGTDLQQLSQTNTRLSAKAQRALDALFPADALKTYSRLAGRSSPFAQGNGAAAGYFKA